MTGGKMAFPKITWSGRGQAGAGTQVFQPPKPTTFLLYLANQELITTCVKK